MKTPDGAKPSSMTIVESFDSEAASDAIDMIGDGIDSLLDAGASLDTPFIFALDECVYCLQKVIVHGSH